MVFTKLIYLLFIVFAEWFLCLFAVFVCFFIYVLVWLGAVLFEMLSESFPRGPHP